LCELLAQTIWPKLFLMQHLPVLVFVFSFGACVGSFVNVVIYRLPAGMSVISPPSRCPICGARLKFFPENLPILGWFFCKGKCRHCGVRISPQYMIIELLMALIFTAFYFLLYIYRPGEGGIASFWWYSHSPFITIPALIALLILIACLITMTIIDARTFLIPLQIPLFATFTAFLMFPIQAMMPLRARIVPSWPIQTMGWQGSAMVYGGMLGLLISYILLRTGRIRYSFFDYNDYLPEGSMEEPPSTSNFTIFELLFFYPLLIGFFVAALAGAWIGGVTGLVLCIALLIMGRIKEGQIFGSIEEPSGEGVLADEYPHTRREIVRELGYLTPCLIGLVAGWFIGSLMDDPPPTIVQALAGSLAGYLMGGGLIWGIRIFASLIVGREAMGLGDVHLLAAVGAVLGWFDPILIFFIAPFFGILWAVLSKGFSTVMKQRWNQLPYGPHLAIATLVIVLFRPALQSGWGILFPMIPWPQSSISLPSPTPATPLPSGNTTSNPPDSTP
jgi:prepilin signal peptidase PulO-like enzyme (type II secretory pathway)